MIIYFTFNEIVPELFEGDLSIAIGVKYLED
jgi:hypothetical protein